MITTAVVIISTKVEIDYHRGGNNYNQVGNNHHHGGNNYHRGRNRFPPLSAICYLSRADLVAGSSAREIQSWQSMVPMSMVLYGTWCCVCSLKSVHCEAGGVGATDHTDRPSSVCPRLRGSQRFSLSLHPVQRQYSGF